MEWASTVTARCARQRRSLREKEQATTNRHSLQAWLQVVGDDYDYVRPRHMGNAGGAIRREQQCWPSRARVRKRRGGLDAGRVGEGGGEGWGSGGGGVGARGPRV